MMLQKRILLIILLVFSMGNSLFSQQRVVFSGEPSTLIPEINQKLVIPDQANLVVNEFVQNWDGGFFNDSTQTALAGIFAGMQNKGFKRSDYLRFLSSLNSFRSENQPQDSFDAWLETIGYLKTQPSVRNLSNFIEQSYDLFKARQLCCSASTKWIYRGGEFFYFRDSVLKIRFQNGDLLGASRRDTSEIIGTKGVFYPMQNQWLGEGGKISWKRLGKARQMLAKVFDYQISLKSSVYSIDSVEFTDTTHFKFPMLGRLDEKIHGSKPNFRTSYPRFYSYAKDYTVDSLLPGVKYQGGVCVMGLRFILDAEQDSLAYLKFNNGRFPFVQVRSNEFVFYNNKITSKRGQVLILFGQDSITHPGVQMKYDNSNRELELNRRATGIAPSPFYSSYHKVDMYCDAIYWNMDSLNLDFGSSKNVAQRSEGVYESANYFSAYDYYRLQGIDPVNPLIVLKKYSEIYNTNIVQLGLLAAHIRKPREQAANMLFNLAEKGFVTYDVEKETAVIKPRLFDFLKAKARMQDYDVIRFSSEVRGKSSGTLELSNFDFYLRGIEQVHLSDSQKVHLYPRNREIILKKNRDFKFAGRIDGGLLAFRAGECLFNYDTFKLDMPKIDSLSFKVKNRKITPENPEELIEVRSVLSDLSGYMLIDDPDNKSSEKSFPEYPIFHNKNEGYVYYEDSATMNNQLKKKDFFYFVEPFTIDSLDNFSTDGLTFKGHLISDSIFPRIDEDLIVMDDYSLGFRHKFPNEGTEMYNGKGRFYDSLELSNEGFFAKGRLTYLNAKAFSEKYLLYPDSVRAFVENFELKESAVYDSFPDAQALRVQYLWQPYADHLEVQTTDTAMQMFNRQASMEGRLQLSPQSLNGSGVFLYENFKLSSNVFDFSNDGLKSDTTDFELYTKDTREVAFSTNNYKTAISFGNRRGNFKSNGAQSVLNFPFNSYVSTMDEIQWNMDNSELIMRNNIASAVPDIAEKTQEEILEMDLSGSEFISLRPDQDSLSFFSLKARYDMDNYIIYAEDVKYIEVADAAIFPYDGKITIKQNAEIPTLSKATILTKVGDHYHKVYNAEVNIFSKNNFVSTTGSFDYIDANGTPQEIKLNTVTVDTLRGVTYGLGEVPQDELFFLNPHFFFTGNVKFTSDNPYSRFYGGFLLNQECDYGEAVWVKFDTIIDPAKVRIPLTEKLEDINGLRLDVGLFYSVNEGVLYSEIFKSKPNISDRDVLNARGIVQFNENDNRFEIGSLAQLEGKSFRGNRLNFELTTCMLNGTGRLNLIDEIEHFKLRSFGECYHSLEKDTTSFRAFLGFDFMFDEKSLKVMSDTIQSFDLEKMRMNREYFKMVMVNAADTVYEKDIVYDLEFYGELREHLDQFQDKLTFTDVFLQWDAEKRIYLSKGKLGLGMINGVALNKYVDGLIMIDRKRSNIAVEIYFEIDEGLWYYFKYSNKLLQAVSSDPRFNNQLNGLDVEKRIIEKSGNIAYEFVISETQKRDDFLRKYRK